MMDGRGSLYGRFRPAPKIFFGETCQRSKQFVNLGNSQPIATAEILAGKKSTKSSGSLRKWL
jgi:hypothetical protein